MKLFVVAFFIGVLVAFASALVTMEVTGAQTPTPTPKPLLGAVSTPVPTKNSATNASSSSVSNASVGVQNSNVNQNRQQQSQSITVVNQAPPAEKMVYVAGIGNVTQSAYEQMLLNSRNKTRSGAPAPVVSETSSFRISPPSTGDAGLVRKLIDISRRDTAWGDGGDQGACFNCWYWWLWQ